MDVGPDLWGDGGRVEIGAERSGVSVLYR